MIKTIKNIIYLSNLSSAFIIINVFGLIVLATLEIMSLGSVYPFLDLLIKNNNNNFQFINKINKEKQILFFLSIIFIIFFIKNLYIILFSYWQKKKLYSKQVDLTNFLYRKYLDNNLDLNKHSSEIQTNINYSHNIPLLINNIFNILSELILLTLILFLMLQVNFKITILIFFISILFFFIFIFIFKRIFKSWSKKALISQTNTIKSQIESFSGLREITILGVKDYFIKKFYKSTFKLSNNFFKVNFIEILPRIILEMLFIFIVSFLLFHLNKDATSFQDIIPTLGLYFVISVRLMPCFGKIITNINSLNFAKIWVNKLMEVKLMKKKLNEDTKKIIKFNYVNFNNVSFSFDKKSHPIKINIKLKNNNFYGVIGKSGSGKTTFTNLLAGLLKPDHGNILIDKINLINCKNNWRKFIGLVSQEVFIINDTLSNNIAIGSEEKHIDQKKIVEVLKQSGLAEFVKKKNNGINFILSENGKNISAGQRQRVGIARALYRNPKILILDEPTSSLDAETSANFMFTLNKIKKNRLVILCTHDLKSLKNADKVIEISDNCASFL
jgi:ABC-type bacteriocin/lantibiotic exporter with double-glycine peptidase domain